MSIVNSITKSVNIDSTTDKVFEFLNNPLNWPQWSVINLKSIISFKDGWYEMETRQGKGQLKMHSDKHYGILDHEWKNDEASWIVPARVVKNETGSIFIITFLKPSVIDEKTFEMAVAEIDIELNTLKNILEH